MTCVCVYVAFDPAFYLALLFKTYILTFHQAFYWTCYLAFYFIDIHSDIPFDIHSDMLFEVLCYTHTHRYYFAYSLALFRICFL